MRLDDWAERSWGRRRKRDRSAPRPDRDPPPVPSPDDIGAGDRALDAAGVAAQARAWFGQRAPWLPRAVVGRGDPRCELFVIGEAPAAEEDRQGIPFAGPSGTLLAAMLAAVRTPSRPQGLTASPGGGAWLTNAAFWMTPPGSPPPSAESEAARPVLAAMLEAARPKAILACGGTASRLATAQDLGVGKLRGAWHEPALAISGWMPEDALTPVMCTWHPAYLLREPGRKRQSWSDLTMVAERLSKGDPPSRRPDPDGPTPAAAAPPRTQPPLDERIH